MDTVAGGVIGRRGMLGLKILAVFIVLLFLSPFLSGLMSVTKLFSLNWWDLVATHSSALKNSYSYAFLSALITCSLGLLFTIVLFVYYGNVARKKLALLCLIPFFASTAARLFSWVLLFSSFGVVGRLLHSLRILPQQESPLSLPSTLVFALVTIYFPVAIFAFYSFGSTVPQSVEEAAAVLGADKFSVNLRIRWRRLTWASVTVLIFTFVSCHSAFMVPSVLGGSAGWFVSTSVDYLLNIALQRDAAFFLSNLDTLILASAALLIVFSYYLVGRAHPKGEKGR
jgi:ABC-type spermidine/putrescine transport system permease subunit I